MQTETPIVMSGVFAQLADEFVAFKRAQGYKYYSEAKVLRRFCHFSENYNLTKPILSKELALDWIAPREGEAAKSRLHRVAMLNQFGRFLVDTGHEAYVPPSRHWTPDSFTPYIFTHEEIGRILQAADHIQPVSQSREMHKELPVLFRLLYGCGLRVSEAVSSPVVIRLTGKGNKARLVPIMTPTEKLLRDYMKEHEQRLHFAGSSPLFQNRDGHKLTRAGIAYILGKYVKDARQAGTIPHPANVSPHVLRHSKAMHLLQAGVNLVYIRDLLGHADVSTTEIYARADEHFKRQALQQAYPSPTPEPETPLWQKDADLLDWLKSLGK